MITAGWFGRFETGLSATLFTALAVLPLPFGWGVRMTHDSGEHV